jgi:hypothetical protein
MRKRKFVIPTAAIAALSIAAVAPSYAQTPAAVTSIQATASISPSKVGTPSKPKSVNLSVKFSSSTSGPDGQNKPILQKVVILFPKGSKYNGANFPSCTQAKLNRDLPKAACPKAIVGSGSGTAWADTVKVPVKFTLVNGGGSKVFLFTELTNPAVVQTPVPGTIKKGGALGGYTLTLTVPDSLKYVAGTPISLIGATIKTKAKNWLQTTGCFGGKFPYQATSYQDTTAPAVFKSSVKCTK